MTSLQRYAHALLERQENASLRKLQFSHGGIDFYSNDYLGLAHSQALAEKIALNYQNLQLSGIINGATGSRLLSGNNEFVIQVEKKLAKLFNAEACLLFNSGYVANTSLLSTVTKKGDTIIYDSLIHASLHEGCRLSFANSWAFQHNNLQELEKKLQLAKGDKFVVIESIYSMDGDIAPLKAIVELCKKHEAYLIVDEAHSTGICGINGNGLCCELGLENEIFARVYTFGKALGVHGACVAGSQILIDYLVNFARGFIYTTALPPHNVVSIDCAFDFIAQNPQLQQQLKENIAFFDKHHLQNTVTTENSSAIKYALVQGNENCRKIAKQLIDKGFEVRPILSPTVAVGEERIRICLHAYNTQEEIRLLLENLERVK